MPASAIIHDIRLTATPAMRALMLAEGADARMVARAAAMFRDMHVPLMVAGTLDQAVRACAQKKPELVLLPANAQGCRLLWQIRRGQAGAGVAGQGAAGQGPAVLALLERAEAGQIARMMAQGADECLVWPFGARLLAARVEMLTRAAAGCGGADGAGQRLAG